jgi:hypothetical protein
MQLQLSREEQALLADVLQDISVSAGRKVARDRILDHLCEHDLSFAYDELEDLSDFLAEISRRLHDQFMRNNDVITINRQAAVQRILDRVIEAEAMV